ncbi:MAG: O-antigen ligase family protein [Acidobacteriaceae bacterium]|nr:O-antigen ligase family protein [Acidobacteriaceae bacterium]
MKSNLERAAFYLTCGSAVSILFSIAVSQILLGLALVALLFSGLPLRLPAIKLPLALFVAGTVISLALSVDPKAGTPQIRKFFVFLILLLIYSTFRSVSQIRNVVLLWAGVETLSAIRSLFQFLQKYQEAQARHEDFYKYYVGDRITGFMSHWMTFGGEEMIVLLMLMSFLFFGGRNRWKSAGVACAVVLFVSLVLGYTRSIFLLGVPLGMLYLLWFWKRWTVVAVPAVALAGIAAMPSLRERVVSVFEPHGERDSNMHRQITRRTGLRMIAAHPVFGLGPEQVKAQFDQWVPPDVPRPLPEGWYGHLHNIYLQYAAERGIPTMLMMMWLIGKVLYDFVRGLRVVAPGVQFVLYGAIASIIAILAGGFLEYNLGDSEVLTLFLSVIAFGYVALEARDVAVPGT